MAGAFDTPKPTRVRLENDRASVDVIVPAFLACYPAAVNAAGQPQIQLQAAYQNPAQLATLIATAIRLGIATGVMQLVYSELTSVPLQVEVEPPRGPRPLDDQPAHLRQPPKKSGP